MTHRLDKIRLRSEMPEPVRRALHAWRALRLVYAITPGSEAITQRSEAEAFMSFLLETGTAEDIRWARKHRLVSWRISTAYLKRAAA